MDNQVNENMNNIKYNYEDYNKTLITAIFLSPFGVHRFIHKKYITGIIQLILTFVFFIGIIWSIVDVFIIMAGKFRDAQGLQIKSKSSFGENPWNYVAIIRQILAILFVIIVPIIILGAVFLFFVLLFGNNLDGNYNEIYDECTDTFSNNICEELLDEDDMRYSYNNNNDSNNNNNSNNSNSSSNENSRDYQEDINDNDYVKIEDFKSSNYYSQNDYVDETYQTLVDNGFTYYDRELTDVDLNNYDNSYEDSFIEFIKYDDDSQVYIHVYVPYNVNKPSDDLLVVEYELENRTDVYSDVNGNYIDYDEDNRDESSINDKDLKAEITTAEYDLITNFNSILF